MNWITENIMAFIADLIGSAIDFFGDFLNNIFFWIVDTALQNEYVVNAEKFIIVTAIGLVSLVVIKVVISGYLLETDYDPEADPFNLIIKVAETVAIIMNSGWLFNWMLETAKTFTSDLLGGASASGFCEITKSLLEIRSAEDLLQKYVAFCILLGFVLIAFIVFMIVAGLRGVELIAMKLFLPFFALDLLTNSRERWNNFFTAYVVAFFSYAVQILFFMVALRCYMTFSAETSPEYYIGTMAFIIMAIRAPKFLEKFIYKSGVSNAASSGIRMVAQTMVMRGAFK